MPRLTILTMILPLLATLPITGCQTAPLPTVKPVPTETLQQVVEQTLIILYNQNIDKNQLNQQINRYKATITHEYNVLNGVAIRLPTGSNMAQAIADFKAVTGVTTVERDSIQTIQPVKNTQ